MRCLNAGLFGGNSPHTETARRRRGQISHWVNAIQVQLRQRHSGVCSGPRFDCAGTIPYDECHPATQLAPRRMIADSFRLTRPMKIPGLGRRTGSVMACRCRPPRGCLHSPYSTLAGENRGMLSAFRACGRPLTCQARDVVGPCIPVRSSRMRIRNRNAGCLPLRLAARIAAVPDSRRPANAIGGMTGWP